MDQYLYHKGMNIHSSQLYWCEDQRPTGYPPAIKHSNRRSPVYIYIHIYYVNINIYIYIYTPIHIDDLPSYKPHRDFPLPCDWLPEAKSKQQHAYLRTKITVVHGKMITIPVIQCKISPCFSLDSQLFMVKSQLIIATSPVLLEKSPALPVKTSVFMVNVPGFPGNVTPKVHALLRAAAVARAPRQRLGQRGAGRGAAGGRGARRLGGSGQGHGRGGEEKLGRFTSQNGDSHDEYMVPEWLIYGDFRRFP